MKLERAGSGTALEKSPALLKPAERAEWTGVKLIVAHRTSPLSTLIIRYLKLLWYICRQPLTEEIAMAKRYRIELSAQERSELESLTRRDRVGAKKFVHARTLLLCDSGREGPAWTSARIAEALGITSRTIENTKRRLVEAGMQSALERKKREVPPVKSIFDGEKEARLLALACSSPPAGAGDGRFDFWPRNWCVWISSRRSRNHRCKTR